MVGNPKQAAHESDDSLKETVNRALRAGIKHLPDAPARRYRLKPASLGTPIPDVDPANASDLSDTLEDKATALWFADQLWNGPLSGPYGLLSVSKDSPILCQNQAQRRTVRRRQSPIGTQSRRKEWTGVPIKRFFLRQTLRPTPPD